MAWVKLDDAFFRHPKVIEAGRDARDLFMAALCYASSQLTDGRIPAGAIRQLGADADIDDPKAAAARLVAVGLWHSVEGGWQVHDYLDYQPSAEQVKAQRAATAERVARWRSSQRPLQDEYKADSNAVTNGATNGGVTPAPVPRPRPVPSPVPEPTPVGVSAHADTARTREAPPPAAFVAFWKAYPLKEGKKAAQDQWRSLRPDAETADAILAGVVAWKAGRRWREGFVMEASRWLKERRWEDEPEPDGGPVRSPPANRRPKLDTNAAAAAIEVALNGNGAYQHDDGSIEVRLRHPTGLLAGPVRGPG